MRDVCQSPHSQHKVEQTQECQERVYVSWQYDTFKIDNAFVYHILSKVITDTDAYVYMEQKKSMQDGQAVFIDDHKPFLSPNHMARQATEAKKSAELSL